MVQVQNQKMHFFLLIPWGMVGGSLLYVSVGFSGYSLLFYPAVESVKSLSVAAVQFYLVRYHRNNRQTELVWPNPTRCLLESGIGAL